MEVRTFEGSPEELSDFVVKSWLKVYQGQMLVPNWSADYLRWQLRLHEPNASKRLIAAYSGTQLAGVLLFVPMDFNIHGQRVTGSHASWLSVDPEFKRQGTARLLQEGTARAHRELGLSGQFGYVFYGSSASQGPKFWLKKIPNLQIIRKVGFWTRVLDAHRAAAWNVNRLEGILSKLAAPIVFEPKVNTHPGLTIRSFQPADLPRCLELARKATQQCELKLDWNERTLGCQLQGFGQCLVAEEGGEVRGCIGFHVLPIHGRTLEPVGIIDLVFVSELSPQGRTELLNSVLLHLRQSGAVVALKLRTGDYPSAFFVRWGWFWRPSDSLFISNWSGEVPQLAPINQMHVLWR